MRKRERGSTVPNFLMNERMYAGMLEATRLTHAGRLHEATAAIQRTLRGMLVPDVAADTLSRTTDAPVEGAFRVIDVTPLPTTEPTDTQPSWRAVVPRGQFLTGSYANQAGTRTYKLYIPSGYRGQALPLVVMLHGCTQTPDDFAAGTRMNELAEEHQCFVVYPAQAPAANGSKCWNWFKAADQHRGQGEPSIIAGITRQIVSTYHVDARRVYVAGLSAGGAMAVIMGMTYPDLYAAIGIHSGLAYAVAHDLPSALAAMQQGGAAPTRQRDDAVLGADPCPRAVPMIVFHGDRDTTVHPRNGDQVIAQWATVHAGGGPHTEAETNLQVTVQRGQVPDGHAYTRAIHHDASGQAIMEQWLVHGAGHAWSGGSPSGSFTDPKGPDAAQEMIRFFYEHPRREAQLPGTDDPA